jgi:DNA-binding winged helix-turn-helix (wHTH) protein
MPSAGPCWTFEPFALDPANACLWRGAEAVPLPPKAFDVLSYLVTHPDRLVTKSELLDAVWPATAVSDAVVRVTIGALRKVLGDTRQPPRFLATVPRRGYRFLAPVTLAPSSAPTPAAPAPPAALPLAPPPLLVEREAVLHQLHTRLAQAQQGTRQVVLVTGEPGMGKTAVVETFATQAMRRTPLWVAHGQCVEHSSTGEAYLPVLEALGGLCCAPEGERLREK